MRDEIKAIILKHQDHVSGAMLDELAALRDPPEGEIEGLGVVVSWTPEELALVERLSAANFEAWLFRQKAEFEAASSSAD